MMRRSLSERVAGCSPVGCHRPLPAPQARLVAFAHAGGGPRQFHEWADALAPGVELWHVTLPGRAFRWRVPFAREWTPLVDELATAIVDDVPRPVALFGHSLGALLAFEVARRLTRAGLAPAHLVVSGRAAPDVARDLELPESDEALLRHVDLAYGGVTAQVRDAPEVLAHFLPILRADLELARRYTFSPDVALTCPITALTGDADPLAPASALEGWRRQTGGDSEIHVLRGGHFALADHEATVLALILRRLL